jgi:hypothetical protein
MHISCAIWICSCDFNSRFHNLVGWFRCFLKFSITSGGILLQCNLQSCAGAEILIQHINWIRYETASTPVDEAILHVISDEESADAMKRGQCLHCVVNRYYGNFLLFCSLLGIRFCVGPHEVKAGGAYGCSDSGMNFLLRWTRCQLGQYLRRRVGTNRHLEAGGRQRSICVGCVASYRAS